MDSYGHTLYRVEAYRLGVWDWLIIQGPQVSSPFTNTQKLEQNVEKITGFCYILFCCRFLLVLSHWDYFPIFLRVASPTLGQSNDCPATSKVIQDFYSLSVKTFYRQISSSLEAARLDVMLIVLLWNLTGISTTLLPRRLPNFRAIGKVQNRISRLRDFARSCGKMPVRLVK